MSIDPEPARRACPGCGATLFTAGADGQPICTYCQTPLPSPARICPACGAPSEPDAVHCSSCGFELLRQCRACGAANPYTARKCARCGQDLEMLDVLIARAGQDRARWLEEVRGTASGIKEREEAAAQARRAEMWAAEERRRQALAQAQAERDRQQRILTYATVGIIVCVVAALVAWTLLTG